MTITNNQGLIFVFELEISQKKKQFTVRLSVRRRLNDTQWVSEGPRRVYSVSDLENLKTQAIDLTLLKVAAQSELGFRKNEGRFFSPSDDFTLLRIHGDFLPQFLENCQIKKILCNPDGIILPFLSSSPLPLKIRVESQQNFFFPQVFLGDISFQNIPWISDSAPVIVFDGNHFRALFDKITHKFLLTLPHQKKLSPKELEGFLKTIEPLKNNFFLELPEKIPKKILQNPPAYPCFDVKANLQYATLLIDYLGVFFVPSQDPRTVIEDLAKGIELHRNWTEENEYKNHLKQLGFMIQANGEWYLPSKTLHTGLASLVKEGWQITLEQKPLKLESELHWDLQVQKNKIHLRAELQVGQQKASFGKLLDVLTMNTLPTLSLDDGSHILIPWNQLQDLQSLKNQGVRDGEALLFDDTDFARVAAFTEKQPHVTSDAHFQALKEFSKDFGNLKKIPIPAPLENVLRPYQKQGFYWLCALREQGFNGLLADDMGLGKTLQVLTLLQHLKNNAPKHPHLLIVPSTLVFNWELEIQKFTPTLRYVLHVGKDRLEKTAPFASQDLVITTYALVRRDLDTLSSRDWDTLILDEAHSIKNPEAQTTQAVKKIKARYRLSLTGTPLENRPEDLWSQFDFLIPKFLGTLSEFKKKYNTPNLDLLKELKIQSKPFILRRLKSQVCLELPEKTEVTLFCEFTEEQKQFYCTILEEGRKRLKQQVSQEHKVKTMHILELILRLRQAACHPALVPSSVESPQTSGKLERVLETANEILSEGYKILIFSQFTSHLKLVRKALHVQNLKTHYLDGETKDRPEVIQQFREDPDACAFMISLKTGGLGLNLVEANTVFLLDPWWNPSAENQAIDRAHRIGQENPVTVYRFLMKDSIEEKVFALQKSKKIIEKSVISEEALDQVALDEETLESLLR